MRPLRILSLCTLSVALIGVDGCAPLSPAPHPAQWENLPPVRADTMGRLVVDGPNAYINGARAATGAYVVDGNVVSTGPNTSAIVILNHGGFVQLDENTDPWFIDGLCQLVRLVTGQMLFKNQQCLQSQAGPIVAVAKSLVNVKRTEQETQLTVLEGHVDIQSPEVARVERYQQYTVESNGMTRITQLTAEQAYATAAWSRRYFQSRAEPADNGVSNAQAAVIGAGIGAILDALFGHGSQSASPSALPSTPPPTTSGSPVQTRPESGGGNQSASPSPSQDPPVERGSRNTDSGSSSGAGSPSPSTTQPLIK
jgi:hypothetical protein